jgi:hypothetical protein
MRIRVLQRPSKASADGLSLKRFEPGYLYDVGTTLGMLSLSEGWAEPVVTEEPALLIPLSQKKQSAVPAVAAPPQPPTLTHEKSLRYVDRLAVAAEVNRRKRGRTSR